MGKEKQHVKFRVTDGVRIVEAVWWGAGQAELPGAEFDLAFSPRLNEFNGKVSVQLRVLNWRRSERGGVSDPDRLGVGR